MIGLQLPPESVAPLTPRPLLGPVDVLFVSGYLHSSPTRLYSHNQSKNVSVQGAEGTSSSQGDAVGDRNKELSFQSLGLNFLLSLAAGADSLGPHGSSASWVPLLEEMPVLSFWCSLGVSNMHISVVCGHSAQELPNI